MVVGENVESGVITRSRRWLGHVGTKLVDDEIRESHRREPFSLHSMLCARSPESRLSTL
jgi:hypothetical protein